MKTETICAVITAAGQCSRMGKFKPLLEIGGISAAKRIISTVYNCGIRNIAVVTGKNDDLLKNHLKDVNVTFLHNKNFASTDMLFSAKIGFKHYVDNYSKILFSPIDVPLFSEKTVKALLLSEKEVAIPVHYGKTGHPVILRTQTVSSILTYNGSGGLKGAITNECFSIDYINVDDEYILLDMDTPDDYNMLTQKYFSSVST